MAESNDTPLTPSTRIELIHASDSEEVFAIHLPMYTKGIGTPLDESDPSLYEIGEAWDIAENTPKWPDGARLSQEDRTSIQNGVREALGKVVPLGKYGDLQYRHLADCIAESVGQAGESDVDVSHLALAFLAGAAWAEAKRKEPS